MRDCFKNHLKMNERFAEWIDAVLPLFRILVPEVMLNILVSVMHAVYISEIRLEISSIIGVAHKRKSFFLIASRCKQLFSINVLRKHVRKPDRYRVCEKKTVRTGVSTVKTAFDHYN